MERSIVTGVSGAIGSALVVKLNNAGFRVTGLSHLIEGEASFQQVSSTFERVHFDYSRPELFTSRLMEAHSGLGKFSSVICCGAQLNRIPLGECLAQDFMSHYVSNCLQPFLLVQHLLKCDLLVGGAQIVLVGSMAGFQGARKYEGLGPYSVSKSALSALAEVMAAEWGNVIRVNTLCLGAVDTPMFKRAFPNGSTARTPDQIASLIYALLSCGFGGANGKILPISD